MIDMSCVLLTQPTITGEQYVGVPLVFNIADYPSLCIFFGNHSTAGNSTPANMSFSYGIAASDTDQRVISVWSEDNVAGVDNGGGHDNFSCILIVDKAGTVKCKANLKRKEGGSIVLDWVIVDGTQRQFVLVAIGGPGVRIAKTGAVDTANATGQASVTGLGKLTANETLLLTFTGRFSGSQQFTDSAFAMNACHVGMTSSASEQLYSSIHCLNGSNPSATRRRQIVGKLIGLWDSTTLFDEASLVSFDADGFTVDWTTVSGGGGKVFYGVIAGPQSYVGTFTASTSTGDQSVTTIPFRPRGTLFQSVNNASNSGTVNVAGLCCGAGMSSAQQGSIDAISANNQATTRADCGLFTNNCYHGASHTLGGAWQLDNACSYKSNNADGWTVNWSTVIALSKQIGFASLGDDKPTVRDQGKSKVLGKVRTK